MPSRTRLLLVEDDKALAQGIAEALAQSGYLVDIAGDARAAREVVTGKPYAVGILDLGLPDGDGLEVLRDWRAAGIAFPVLILSARGGLDDRVRGLDEGADDYLIKPFSLTEIEARLRALLRRPNPLAAWHQIGRVRFDRQGKRAMLDDRDLELTRREWDVLERLIDAGGRTVSKAHLIDAVFSSDVDVGTNALEVHISRLRHKIRPGGVTIRSLRGLGYRIEEPADGSAEGT